MIETGNLHRLHMIRHAHYEGLDLRLPRYIGRTDRRLSEIGRRQAVEHRAFTANLADVPLFTSTLCRAVETADLMFPGRQKRLTSAAVEIAYGALEGLTSDEAARLYPEEFGGRLNRPVVDCRPFGGESIEDLVDRGSEMLNLLSTQRQAVLISHGIFMRVLAGLLTGSAVTGIPPFALCGRLTFARNAEGRWALDEEWPAEGASL